MTTQTPTKPNPVALAAPATTPAAMLTKALETGANVDVLEKLLGLQERWEATQARKAFEQALADLRAELPPIVKTQQASMGVGRPTYKYEDLSEMVDALSPVLSQHGLSFRWRTESARPDAVTVTCIIAHRDGHSEQTSLTAAHDTSGAKNPVQALGSTVTYLQRYTLKAALGIAASCDDDAQAVSTSVPHRPEVPKPTAAKAAPVVRPVERWPVVDPKPKKSASEWTVGTVEQLDVRTGETEGRTWTKFGANVAGSWYGTFTAPLGQAMQELEGQPVKLGWYPDGKYRTAVSIEPWSETAEDDVPEPPPLPSELDDDRLL